MMKIYSHNTIFILYNVKYLKSVYSYIINKCVCDTISIT